MLKLQGPSRALLRQLTVRHYSTVGSIPVEGTNESTGESGENPIESHESESAITQRQLRERAFAEALAREEEAQAKAKLLVELRQNSKQLITQLNKAPVTLVKSRLKNLQKQLRDIDFNKINELDKQLEEFMVSHMKLPTEEISNRPWAEITSKKTLIDPGRSKENGSEDSSSKANSSTTSNSLLDQFPYLKPTPDHHEYSTQELFLRYLNHAQKSGNLGSKLTNIYKPKNEIKKPRSINEISISHLLAAGCHLGHAKAMWRPSTQPFIYGEYDGIHLIDLNETLVALKRAVKVIKGVANKGGLILYVGTSKNWEQQRALEEAANRSNGYYISRRWIPGTITNFTQVTRQPGERRLEIDMLDKPTNKEVFSTGLIKPDLIVIMNPVENKNCINECIKLRIPTIGLCDTDMEPSLLTYPIPSNDDSMRVSSLMLGILSRAANEGIQSRHEKIIAFKESKEEFVNRM